MRFKSLISRKIRGLIRKKKPEVGSKIRLIKDCGEFLKKGKIATIDYIIDNGEELTYVVKPEVKGFLVTGNGYLARQEFEVKGDD